ncbi:MAG: hypothetical protein AAFX09_05835 [Pseudomonadota bacterium]
MPDEFKHWRNGANSRLLDRYAITLTDVGVEDADLQRWLGNGSDPEDWVTFIGNKFDLTEKQTGIYVPQAL